MSCRVSICRRWVVQPLQLFGPTTTVASSVADTERLEKDVKELGVLIEACEEAQRKLDLALENDFPALEGSKPILDHQHRESMLAELERDHTDVP